MTPVTTLPPAPVAILHPQGQPENLTAMEATFELIGAFLSTPECRQVVASMDLDTVFDDTCRAVLASAISLHKAGDEPALGSVLARLSLNDLHVLDEYAAAAGHKGEGARRKWLTELAVDCFNPAGASSLVKTVREASEARKWSLVADRLKATAMNGGDVAAVLQDVPRAYVDAQAAPLARQWTYTPPHLLPPRQWLYNKHWIRRYVSATVAPGGSGKSLLKIAEALTVASGRGLLGVMPEEPTGRVMYLNLEDPLDETERRVAAAMLHFHLTPEDIEDRLFLGSGRDCGLVLASETRDGLRIHEPVVDKLTAFIQSNGIDVLIVDPFVSCHEVSENSNSSVDRVVKLFAKIAEKTDCAIELVHHTRKTQAGAVADMQDARGAGSLIGAIRSGHVVNPMSEDEAQAAGVEERWRHFKVSSGKANLSPQADKATWYRLASVDLGNGDQCGVVTSWTWPAKAQVCLDDVEKVWTAIEALPEDNEATRDSSQSPDWIGFLVAETLGLELPKSKKRIGNLLQQWVSEGYLVRTTKRTGKSGNARTFLTPPLKSSPPENLK